MTPTNPWRDIPPALLGELAAAVEELPAEENATARQLLALGEHTVERFTAADGTACVEIDAGPLLFITAAPEDAP